VTHDLATAVALVQRGRNVDAAALLGSLRPRVAGDEVYAGAVSEALRALADGRNEQALFLLETLGRLCRSEPPPPPRLAVLPAGARRARIGSGSFRLFEAAPEVD
jgi:hypothetical protein